MGNALIDLPPALLRELHTPRAAHPQRAMLFIALYFGSAAAAILVCREGSWLRILACTPLFLLAAASLHGLSLFTHEAVHGTLSRNRRCNAILGAMCAWPVLQNYSAYRVLHLRHHDHLGHEGDPDHYDNYTRWSWLVFAMHWSRLLVGYPVYIVAIPVLGLRHGNARARMGIFAEILCTLGLATIVLLAPMPMRWIVLGWVIPMAMINTLVNIRGMSQHTLLEHHDDDIRGTRSILTSRLVAFFMCNENYHLEHHLYPGVPWYNLPALHRATREQLQQRGAPFISSYTAFVRDFIVGSIRRSPMGSRR